MPDGSISLKLTAETSQTSGVDDYVLLGALPGCLSFQQKLNTSGITVKYIASYGNQIESGVGLFISPDILRVTRVLSSSNSNQKISWPSQGQRIVVIDDGLTIDGSGKGLVLEGLGVLGMLGVNTETPDVYLDIKGNILRFGGEQFPARYTFLDTGNAYFVMDRLDSYSDASIVFRNHGNARGEIGIFGSFIPSEDDDFQIKTVSGDYLSEIFTTRFQLHAKTQVDGSLAGTSDFFGPGPLRRFAQSGRASIVLGTLNGREFPDGSGTGLEIIYNLDNDEAIFQAITWDLFYRNITFQCNKFKIQSGPVFLVEHAFELDDNGALTLGEAISLADTAFVSNSGAAGIALMSGYVPGTDILTILGGTGTASTWTVTNTQVSGILSIISGGSGGTDGDQIITGTTGTGTKFQWNVVISGGSIVEILDPVEHGDYTVNPSSLSNEPVTGASLSGASVSIKMGVRNVSRLAEGALTIKPSTPVSTSSSAAGTGATLAIVYQNSEGTINVSDAYWANGIKTIDNVANWLGKKIGLAYGGTNADLSATGGAGYVLKQDSVGAAITVGPLSGGSLALTEVIIDNGAGNDADIYFKDGGIDKFVIFKAGDNSFVGYDYENAANFLYVGTSGGVILGETGVAGVEIGNPTGGVLESGSLNLESDLYNNGVAPTGTGGYVRAEGTPVFGTGSPASSTQLTLNQDGVSDFSFGIVDGFGNFVARFDAGGSFYYQAYSVDGATQGPAEVLSFRNTSPADNDQLGHRAFQGNDASHLQVQTYAAMYGLAKTVASAGMYGKLRFGVMNNVGWVNNVVGQPNTFIDFDSIAGLVLPTVPLSGVSTLTAQSVIAASATTGEVITARFSNDPGTSATDASTLALRVDGTDKLQIKAGRDGGNTYGIISMKALVGGTMTEFANVAANDGTNFDFAVTGKISSTSNITMGGTLYHSTHKLIDGITNYTQLFDYDGNGAFYMGGSVDPQNYYRNTTHNFQSVSGNTNFAALTSSGLTVYNKVQATSYCSSEVTYANRPGSPQVGEEFNCSDSSTAVWGATIAGSGSNHVLARWNGSNWTVVGI